MAEVSATWQETSTLSNEGRVVIPAGIRKRLGLVPGTVLSFREEDGHVVMTTQMRAIEELQRMFARHPGTVGVLASDELIAERRAEAARENAR